MNICKPSTPHFFAESKIINLIEAESKMVVARGWEERQQGVVVKGYKLLFI